MIAIYNFAIQKKSKQEKKIHLIRKEPMRMYYKLFLDTNIYDGANYFFITLTSAKFVPWRQRVPCRS